MNNQVLTWLQKAPNQFTSRALVEGTVVERFADRTGHSHFSIDLNDDGKGDLEVIYQNAFGQPPTIQPGMKVGACGDFIADRKSPNGGIIHWVHCNPGDRDQGKHADGYITVNGNLYGFTPPAGEPACNVPQ